MLSLTVNTPSFKGSRELIINSQNISKPVQELLTTSNLKAATEELLQDLNGMVLPKPALVDEVIKAYQQSFKENKATSEKLAEEKVQRLFLNA
jgi:uncharacterized membrane-anchored protein YhcB (DUF1043 family)